MKKLKDSYALARASLFVIRQDMRIVLAQLFGFISLVLTTAVVGYGLYLTGYLDTVEITDDSVSGMVTVSSVIAAIIWYLACLCIYHITEAYISQRALSVVRRGAPSESSSTNVPMREQIVPLVQFAVISGTVGILIKTFEDQFSWFRSLAAYLAQGAWNLATVFAIVMIVDGQARTGIEATKKSVGLLSRSFGESIAVRISIGSVLTLFVFLWLLVFVAVLPILAIIVLESIVVAGWAAGIGLGGLVFVLFLSTVFDSVLTVMLYEYVRTGKETAALDKALFQQMITPKKAALVFKH